MARYIDAVKTADVISERLNIPLGDLVDIFAEIPTADVEEVVRCGKCKHGEVSIMSKAKDGEEEIACYCNAKNKVTDLEYYCACGERRDK